MDRPSVGFPLPGHNCGTPETVAGDTRVYVYVSMRTRRSATTNAADRQWDQSSSVLYSNAKSCIDSETEVLLVVKFDVAFLRGLSAHGHSLACGCGRPCVLASTASQPINASSGRLWTTWCRSAICVRCVRRRMFGPHAVASMVAPYSPPISNP